MACDAMRMRMHSALSGRRLAILRPHNKFRFPKLVKMARTGGSAEVACVVGVVNTTYLTE